MEDLLTMYAEKALAFLAEGVAFIQGELPLYIEEILKWQFTHSLFYVILSGLFTIGAVVLLIKGIKILSTNIEIGVAFIVIGGFSCFFIIPLCSYTLEMLQILISPRVYLIEYFSRMMK